MGDWKRRGRMKRAYRALPLYELADTLGVGACTVYRWVKRDVLRVKTGNSMTVPGAAAHRIVRDWKRSQTQSEAARTLGLRPNSVGSRLAKDRLTGIRVLGKIRVLNRSVRRALAHPVPTWRWNSRTARQASYVRWHGRKRRR